MWTPSPPFSLTVTPSRKNSLTLTASIPWPLLGLPVTLRSASFTRQSIALGSAARLPGWTRIGRFPLGVDVLQMRRRPGPLEQDVSAGDAKRRADLERPGREADDSAGGREGVEGRLDRREVDRLDGRRRPRERARGGLRAAVAPVRQRPGEGGKADRGEDQVRGSHGGCSISGDEGRAITDKTAAI